MAIVTTAQVKTYLGITTSSEDDKLNLMVGAADSIIKSYLGIDVESTSYSPSNAASQGFGDSGYYVGTGSRFLYLRQYPVTAVSSIYVDSEGFAGQGTSTPFASDSLLVEGDDYFVHWDGALPGSTTKCSYKAVIERVGGIWPGVSVYHGNINYGPGPGQGNIKISYTAGWTTVPADIVNAAIQLVANLRTTSVYGVPLKSERYEDYQYSLGDAKDIIGRIGSIKSILGRYKRRLVA